MTNAEEKNIEKKNHIILRNMTQFQGRRETREILGSCLEI